MTFLPYLTGGLAGILNGLLGTGGGILLVPMLISVHKLPAQKAFATSLAIILPLSAVTFWLFTRQDPVELSSALPYLLGGSAGGLLAGKWLKRLPIHWLRRLFGGLLLLAGLRAVLA